MSSARAGTGTAPPAPRRPRAPSSRASWRLTDRLGLAFAWFLGLLFCAITAAIVLYLARPGDPLPAPELFVTNPHGGLRAERRPAASSTR